MPKDPREPRRTGSRFQEHRIHPSRETVLETTVADLARVDDGLGDLVGRQA